MARSVTYSVVPRRNPNEKNTPPRYYAQAQARGDVSLREMSERIQATCTVHKTDVYAVLVALEDVIADALQNGEIVRLGELCTLQVLTSRIAESYNYVHFLALHIKEFAYGIVCEYSHHSFSK